MRAILPGDLEWWHDRGQHLRPTVLLCCGIDGCRATVGVVLVDDTTVRAVMYHKHGDRTVPYTPRRTEQDYGYAPGVVLVDRRTGETFAEQQDSKFQKLDAETLRYLDEGRRVAKRYDAGESLMPLDLIPYIVCPEHGLVHWPPGDIDNADDALCRFVDDTTPASGRRYVMFNSSRP